ncbi:MAG: heme-binding domain-containing protein [Gemmatimonadota bacterium]
MAIGIQFVPVRRTNPPVRAEVEAPQDVEAVLRRACFDCHSNGTEWPWYSRVAPASWLVARDVHKARDDMNFTEWPASDPDEVADLIEEIGEQIERDAMPPKRYRLLHPEARLSAQERQLLVDWSLAAGGWDRLEDRLPGGR